MSAQVRLISALLLFVGCSANTSTTSTKNQPLPTTETVASSVSSPTSVSSPANKSWKDQIGETVTLTGQALNTKIGAYLRGDGFGIYVDLPDEIHWPNGLYHGGDSGEKVQVTGTIAQRSDLPVFIPDPNTPSIQGMPVPPGSNLKEMEKRFILENVEWKRIVDGSEGMVP